MQKFLNIEWFFFIENFGEIGICLWCCWKHLDAGLNGILFGNICCLIRQAVIGKFNHNTGYINKNLKERRRSKNPIRRKIKYKEKEKHKRARNGDATKRYEEGNREKHWINLNAKLLRGKTGLGLNISCLRCVQTNHETRSRLASVA